MSFQPEHKPNPWDKVASANAKAAQNPQVPRLNGLDPGIDANILRASADIEPADIAQFAIPARPNTVLTLLSERVDPEVS